MGSLTAYRKLTEEEDHAVLARRSKQGQEERSGSARGGRGGNRPDHGRLGLRVGDRAPRRLRLRLRRSCSMAMYGVSCNVGICIASSLRT